MKQGDAAVRIYEKDMVQNTLVVAASAKEAVPDLDHAGLVAINSLD